MDTQIEQENLLDGSAYGLSCEQYEQKTEKVLAHSDTIIVAGYGCGLRVERDTLVIKNGFTHDGQANTSRILYRGVHGVRSIVLLADSGNISIDALKWCHEQEITVSMLDSDGSLLQSLTLEQAGNITIRRAQYQASKEKNAYIVYRLICEKTKTQLATLQMFADVLPEAKRALEIFNVQMEWLALPDLPRWKDIDYMRGFEGRLSTALFIAMRGLPIQFNKADAKIIPPHWKEITERTSPIFKMHGARYASCTFHAMLNYAYAVLESQCRQALTKTGFDISAGILHVDKACRDSLVYDLMELYRGKIDTLVLKLVTSTTFKKGDFVPVSNGSVRLNPQLARYVVASCSLSQIEVDKGAMWLKSLMLDNSRATSTEKSA